MIELDKVTKVYQMGKLTYQALKGVSFRIERGELVAIIGPSGSGKTTTMNMLGLLDNPSTGHYLLGGKDTTLLSANELADMRNRKIGFVFQFFFLLPRLTALQNVGLPLFYSRQKAEYIKEKSLEMLKRVGMIDFAHHKPNELSGGQKQRVAIARALVNEPEIILADEPTGSLDSKATQEILDLLTHQLKGTTVIIITHDPNVAKQCPRVLEIYDGVIVRDTRL